MIERIRLRNFRRYRDATLRFEAGVNLIEGRNNVGKTTLFYAIEYALFGRVENFKTIRALMQPGKRSLGVELIFQGQKGERYLLQRMHQLPAKSKKTLEGHFTLKEILPDGERYLLASDFGDTEDKLALKMRELTGLTRRLFSVALHMRQGEIPAILDGAKQLDIVLGVTAAAMAEEEIRQMAMELEKESAGLPVLMERLRSLGNELAQVAEELANLASERQATEAKLRTLGETADPRAEAGPASSRRSTRSSQPSMTAGRRANWLASGWRTRRSATRRLSGAGRRRKSSRNSLNSRRSQPPAPSTWKNFAAISSRSMPNSGTSTPSGAT